jgi:Uma2 family endonuclease
MAAIIEDIVLDPEKEYEIVDGHPEEKEMAGARHGGVAMRLGSRINMFSETHRLGGVYTPDTTFTIGTNERMPDISFVASARIPEDGEPEGKWLIAPDLAIEIISPNDIHEKLTRRVIEFFGAGVREVWLVSPEFKTVTIYRSPTSIRILTEEDEIVSEEILPGFRCRVSELFKIPGRE